MITEHNTVSKTAARAPARRAAAPKQDVAPDLARRSQGRQAGASMPPETAPSSARPPAKSAARRRAAVSAAPVELAGSIALRSGSHTWGSQKRMALLEAIGEAGSITAAAKQIGLSYKAAWDAVDAMNNLAGEPLVLRSTGGQRGGGAQLTARAVELLQVYQALNTEHQRFLAALAKAGRDPTHHLQLIQQMMIQTSARNKFAATVSRVVPGAVNDEIVLDMGEGQELTAIITGESARNLGLAPGRQALAFIKASSIMVGLPGSGADGARLKLSARNQLRGRVSQVVSGAVNCEVRIELPQGRSLAAIITMESAKALKLKEGTAVLAIFKASSVMLGVME